MKKWISTLLIIGLIIPLISGCNMDKIESKFDISNLTGDIILEFSSRVNKDTSGIYIYSFKGDDVDLLLGGYFGHRNIEYNNDKTKILTEDRGDFYTSSIIEYDIARKKIEIIRDEKIKYKYYHYIKYVPNSNKISYTVDDVLYVFDRDTGEETTIMKDLVYGNYSWDKKGEKLIYESKLGIYIYDIKAKERKELFIGGSPIYSNNNEYIAYTYNDALIIHELETGKEWNLGELSSHGQYIFSPDDRYISYSEEYYSKKLFSRRYNRDYKIFIEDFKNGGKIVLLEGEGNVPSYDWK